MMFGVAFLFVKFRRQSVVVLASFSLISRIWYCFIYLWWFWSLLSSYQSKARPYQVVESELYMCSGPYTTILCQFIRATATILLVPIISHIAVFLWGKSESDSNRLCQQIRWGTKWVDNYIHLNLASRYNLYLILHISSLYYKEEIWSIGKCVN